MTRTVHPARETSALGERRASAIGGPDRRREGCRRRRVSAGMARTLPPDAVLSRDVLDAMADRGVIRSFTARTVVLHECDVGHALFVILHGRVKVFGSSRQGREVVYRTQGAGEMFGELCLDGGARSASVMTLEPTTCVMLTGRQVTELMAEHPELGQYLVGKLIGMVRSATRSIKRLALGDAQQRLANLLESLDCVDEHGQRVIRDRLTQQAMADRIGCSREMVSRLLARLRRSGHVSMRGRRIVLLKRLPQSG